ncbi:hypothetical protein WS105_0615 [Weissella ceti]|nr:hypothetical protein WS105_0615 [Weissella ceti]
MFDTRLFILQKKQQTPDGIGGFSHDWQKSGELLAYLDLIAGSNQPSIQNASIEGSTHILMVPDVPEYMVTDQMRIVDTTNRWYTITYVDNPMGQNNHLEIYVTFGGVLDGV